MSDALQKALEPEYLPPTKLNRLAQRWRGGRQRSYTDQEVGTALAVLEYYNGNALRTARELGIPRQTIVEWVKKAEALNLPPAVVAIREAKREEFARYAEEAAEWIITSITPRDVKKASLLQKATSYGILRDKALLDRGEATTIVEHRSAADALERQIDQLLEVAQRHDPAITREQVEQKLLERKPEYRKLLNK